MKNHAPKYTRLRRLQRALLNAEGRAHRETEAAVLRERIASYHPTRKPNGEERAKRQAAALG